MPPQRRTDRISYKASHAILAVAGFIAWASTAGAITTRPPATYPEDTIPEDVTDWNSLNRVLLQQGVNLPAVNWTQVNALCGNPPSDNESEAYRQYRACQYRMVMRRELFLGDRDLCTRDAERKYNTRSAILMKPTDTVRTVTGPDGKITKTVRETARMPGVRELRRLREQYVVECMMDSGWVEPDDWTYGRR